MMPFDGKKKSGLGRRINDISKTAPRLKDIGARQEKIDPEFVRKSLGADEEAKSGTQRELSAVYFTESRESTAALSLVAKTFQGRTVSLSRRIMLCGSLTDLIWLAIKEILRRRAEATTWWISTKRARIQAHSKDFLRFVFSGGKRSINSQRRP